MYVLAFTEDDVHLWDPLRGTAYPVSDAFCPLRHVSLVISADNAWANVQPSAEPCSMGFNLAAAKHWEPLFGRALRNPGLSTVQAAVLRYEPPAVDAATQLAGELERLLARRMEGWRTVVTRWNRHAAALLRTALGTYEDMLVRGVAPEDPLAEMALTHRVVGFPLHMEFSSAARVTDAVFNAGVHASAAADSELALAVHVHAYPAGVYAVWVYVAELARR